VQSMGVAWRRGAIFVRTSGKEFAGLLGPLRIF
jgi:hypothetical protein